MAVKLTNGKAKKAGPTPRGRREILGLIRKGVAGMTPAERRRVVAHFAREADRRAPSAEAVTAGADLLRVVLAAVREFVARYYPDARSASVVIHGGCPPRCGPPEYHVMLPCPVPAKG